MPRNVDRSSWEELSAPRPGELNFESEKPPGPGGSTARASTCDAHKCDAQISRELILQRFLRGKSIYQVAAAMADPLANRAQSYRFRVELPHIQHETC